jgi:GT2 family glycosyltransferase
MSAPSVSVVICAHTEERWDDTLAAAASVRRQSYAAKELIVVVDHNPRLYHRLKSALPGATVTENREEPGLSGGRNTGVALAAGEIVAFLDDDAVAEPDWLKFLVDAYSDPAVAGVGGLTLPLWDGERPSWFPREFDWVVGCSYTGLPTQRTEIRNPIGTNMAFRRAALTSVGGFVDGIGRIGTVPLGCEETELAIRVRDVTGGRVLHVPEARVQHRVPATRVTWRYFVSRCWAEGLSKAHVAARVGSGPALASERRYATRTLPRGAGRGVRDAVRGDPGGVARASAIVSGLAVTSLGYAVGVWRLRTQIPRRHGAADRLT